jgi:DNA-binding CsgD family transcriptional regulator
VDLARAAHQAPSIHNTQPWLLRARDAGVDVDEDSSRRLPGTDPLGRESVISCGAALRNAEIALARLGRVPDAALLPDGPGTPRVAALRASSAGASGYLLKQIRGTDLVEAIRTVAAGGSLLDPAVTQRVLERIRSGGKREPEELGSLTPQERRILELVAQGMTNRQIGAEMFLAEKTVKNYVSSLLAKLGLERRTQAAVLANKLLGQ